MVHTITVNGVERVLSPVEMVLIWDLSKQHSLGMWLTKTVLTLCSRNLEHLAKVVPKMNTLGIGCKLLLLNHVVAKESTNV